MTARARPRRGGILFEILLSIAIFVGAAAFTLGAARSVLDGIDRMQRRQRMLDHACTRMAELELGIVTIATLREEGLGGVSFEETPAPFIVDVETERSAFAGLSLVELTVRERGEDGGPTGPSVELRQLVALQRRPPSPYEPDRMLDGLPEAPPPDETIPPSGATP